MLPQRQCAVLKTEGTEKENEINHGAVAAIVVIGVWMLALLVFLIGRFCRTDL